MREPRRPGRESNSARVMRVVLAWADEDGDEFVRGTRTGQLGRENRQMLVGTYEKVGISILAFSSLARCSMFSCCMATCRVISCRPPLRNWLARVTRL
jgi:hypothetical protein